MKFWPHLTVPRLRNGVRIFVGDDFALQRLEREQLDGVVRQLRKIRLRVNKWAKKVKVRVCEQHLSDCVIVLDF